MVRLGFDFSAPEFVVFLSQAHEEGGVGGNPEVRVLMQLSSTNFFGWGGILVFPNL